MMSKAVAVDNSRLHASQVASGERFEFGKNWSRFLASLNQERITVAGNSLRKMLEVEDLNGKSFLDIGSGSGLFSLAARRLGARVHSFDYDPQSVACTAELKRRFFPEDGLWTVEEGSALDADYLRSLGPFDIVYSWGVLHHTGHMWRALENVQIPVAPGGKLFIAIYNATGSQSARWKWVKRIYNKIPRLLRLPFTLVVIAPGEAKSLLRSALTLQFGKYVRSWSKPSTERGMSRWRDIVDWVGGYPYEVARPEEVFDFYRPRGFELTKLKCGGVGLGCNEYVFVKNSRESAIPPMKLADLETAPLPKIAIVVLNYGTANLTDELASYLIHHLNYPNKKVYIIDNGSPSRPALTTHALAENLGFTLGMYEGYKVASGEDDYDAYWFLNSDVGFEYGNHVLLHLVDVLFSSDSYAQIAPQHNSPHSFMEDAQSEAQAVPYLEPTATLIKATTLRSVGFWDLDLTYGWGVDYDYGYRVRRAGLLNILTNRARITHKEHQSITDLSGYINKASAEMNHVLRGKYGEDWIRITHPERNIVPLILSCDCNLDLVQQFVSSYKTVRAGLARPIVIIDISSSTRLSGEYLSLIAQLDPQSVHIHPKERDLGIYDSVQEAVDFGFNRALEETVSDDLILFIEDDIIFSSRFLPELLSMQIKPDTGFVSLYSPGHEYGAREIEPGRFYGTQCVLFPRRSVQEIADNWIEIKSRIPPGYDIRWSRFLGERGYKLYSTKRSFVQHLQSRSRLHNDFSHVSNSFVG